MVQLELREDIRAGVKHARAGYGPTRAKRGY